MVSHTGSSLSAVYQPKPAAGPRPFASYCDAIAGSVPYELPAGGVSRAGNVVGRLAVTTDPPAATVVFANCGITRLTGSVSVSLPSSTSDRMAVLVIALVCVAMREVGAGLFPPAA